MMKKKIGLALLLALVLIPVNSSAATSNVYVSNWMHHITNKTIALEEGWLYEYEKINPEVKIVPQSVLNINDAEISQIANSNYYIDSGSVKIRLNETVKCGASFTINIENAVWAFASADSTLKTPKQTTVSGVIQTSVTLPQAVKAGKAGVALKEPYFVPTGSGAKPRIVGNGVELGSGTYLEEKSVVPSGWKVYVGTTGALQSYVGKILSTEFVVPDKQSVILGGAQKIPTGTEFKLAPGSVIAAGSVFLEGATVPKGAVIAEGSEIEGSIIVSKPEQLRTAVEMFKEGEFYRLNEKAFEEFGVNIEVSEYMKPDKAVPESKVVRDAGEWELTEMLPPTTYNVENGIFIPSDKKDGSGTYYRYKNNVTIVTRRFPDVSYSETVNEISYAFSLSQKNAKDGVVTILEDAQAGKIITIPLVIRTIGVGKTVEAPVITVSNLSPIGGIEIGVQSYTLALSGR